MPAANSTKTKLWTARVLTGFAIAFLLMDAGMKVLQLPPAVQGTIALGFPASAVLGIGLLELACIVLYATPRTSLRNSSMASRVFSTCTVLRPTQSPNPGNCHVWELAV